VDLNDDYHGKRGLGYRVAPGGYNPENRGEDSAATVQCAGVGDFIIYFPR